MNRRPLVVLVVSLSLLATVATPGRAAAPIVPHLDEKGALVIPPDMKKALDELFPGFQTWSASDYSRRARQSSADTKSAIAPFALVRDVNQDGRPDLIVDGHDNERALVIGVVSSDDGYVARLVSVAQREDPRRTVDWTSGKPDAGFNHYFMGREGRPEVVSIGFTEMTAKDGNVTEGRIVDYIFSDGEFNESDQPL